jgi:hypothetical protein
VPLGGPLWHAREVIDSPEDRMQTSRFQLGLIAALALGLGYTLSSSPAIGYPAAASVSFGNNPVRSYGGTLSDGETVTLDTLPSDQDFVVTDISLSAKSTGHDCLDRVAVTVSSSDTTVASYLVATAYARGSYASHTRSDPLATSMSSGLRISAGETLRIGAAVAISYTYSGCASDRDLRIHYTVAGYYAQR